MLDFLFLTGQAASALLLLYGGYLAGSSSLAGWFECAPQARVPDMDVEVELLARAGLKK